MSPGSLRGTAINQIIGIMANAHERGLWAPEHILTETDIHDRVVTTIIFRVGYLPHGYDYRTPDPRETVTIRIHDSSEL